MPTARSTSKGHSGNRRPIANSCDGTIHPSRGPYYPGVVELASQLIRRRIFNLAELPEGRLPAVVSIC
jgi:hypothetical protein